VFRTLCGYIRLLWGSNVRCFGSPHRKVNGAHYCPGTCAAGKGHRHRAAERPVGCSEESFMRTIDNLTVSADDLQQYGRRYSIRIENIPVTKGESEEDLSRKVKDVLKIANVDVQIDTIDRLHRSSAPRTNADGTVVAQTIVKFRHWGPRRQAHNGRVNARKSGFSIKHDLTKRRYNLLKSARQAIKDKYGDTDEVFAFADINCNLKLRSGASVSHFNTEAELEVALSTL
jgi:hypothetical protein